MRRRYLGGNLVAAVLVAMGLIPMLSGAAHAQGLGTVTADFFLTDLDNTALLGSWNHSLGRTFLAGFLLLRFGLFRTIGFSDTIAS